MKKEHASQKRYTNTIIPQEPENLKYQRLIVKISGEMLGTKKEPFNLKSIGFISKQITTAYRLGAKIGVVIGGGNLMRGREIGWLNKVDADICGMMATVINGIILHEQLQKNDISSKLSSGIEVSGIVQRCNKFEDLRFYESGGLLVFIGGTGNPLFTTDTAAALRAVEFGADVLIKATNVEGVYTADPKKNSSAKLYKRLNFDEAIEKKLAIMDLAAFAICKESNVPICVYNFMHHPLKSIIAGEDVGTLIADGGYHD